MRKLVRPISVEEAIINDKKKQLHDWAISKYGSSSPWIGKPRKKLFCTSCKKKFRINSRRTLQVKPWKKEGYCSIGCYKNKPKKKLLLKVKTDFYLSKQWRELRYKVLKHFNRRCMVCYRTEVQLRVDHIKPISRYPHLRLDITNLQVLCIDCNIGKGNKDSIDWRPTEEKE